MRGLAALLLALGVSFVARGAETVAVFGSDWMRPAEAEAENGVLRFRHVPGKWPRQEGRIPLAAGRFHAFSVDCRVPGVPEGDDGGCEIRFGDIRYPVRPDADWGTAVVYGYAEKADEAVCSFMTVGSTPFAVETRNARVRAFAPDECKRIELDFHQASPAEWRRAATFKPELGDFDMVDANDHVSGGYALEIRAADPFPPEADGKDIGLFSTLFPVLPGARYRVTGWLKGDDDGTVRIGYDGWVSGQTKHWYVTSRQPVTKEWREFSFEFAGPDLEDMPQMAKRTAYFNIALLSDFKWLRIKDLVLEEVDG